MESPEEREANKREREGSEKKEKKPKVKAMPAKVKAKPKAPDSKSDSKPAGEFRIHQRCIGDASIRTCIEPLLRDRN